MMRCARRKLRAGPFEARSRKAARRGARVRGSSISRPAKQEFARAAPSVPIWKRFRLGEGSLTQEREVSRLSSVPSPNAAPFKAANQPSRYYSWVWDTAGQRAFSEREKFAPTRKHTRFIARLQPPNNRRPLTSGSARGSRREADRREKQALGEATCRTSYR
jgi:hypothetical protein